MGFKISLVCVSHYKSCVKKIQIYLTLSQKIVLRLESVPVIPDSSSPCQVIRINLNSIVATVSGPKRPQDRVAVTEMKRDFHACLSEKVGLACTWAQGRVGGSQGSCPHGVLKFSTKRLVS